MDSLRRYIKDTIKTLVALRSPNEAIWTTIETFTGLMPTQSDSFAHIPAEYNKLINFGTRQTGKPLEFIGKMASGLMALTCNPAQLYFDLGSEKDELENEVDTIEQQYIAKLVDAEVNVLERGRFYQQVPIATRDAISYGVGYVKIHKDKFDELFPISFSSGSVWKYYINVDHKEMVDTIFEKITLTYSKALGKFGKLPESVEAEYLNSPDKELDFWYCIFPAKTTKHLNKHFKKGFQYRALYYCDFGEGHIIEIENGYKNLPIAVLRFNVPSGAVYGAGYVYPCLPDIINANRTQYEFNYGISMAWRPMLGIPQDIPLDTDTMMYGPQTIFKLPIGSNSQIQVLNTGANPKVALDTLTFQFEQLKESLYNDAFLLPTENREPFQTYIRRMTQNQAILIEMVSRVTSDIVATIVTHTLDVMDEFKLFPDNKPAAFDYKNFKIRYISSLMSSQRASELNGLLQLLDIIQNLSPTNDSINDEVNMGRLFGRLVRALGVRKTILNSKEEKEKIREEKAKLAEQEQYNQTMMAQANYAKTMSEAQGNGINHGVFGG